MLKYTPFYHVCLQSGATMEGASWVTPACFSSIEEECLAVRQKVGITDFSTMSKFDIKGPDSKQFLQKMIVNDINKLKPGKGLYSCMVNEEGGMFDDTTVFQFTEDHFFVVGSTAGRQKDIERFKKYSEDYKVYITDVTSAFGLLSVQGPFARDLLNSVCDSLLNDVDYFEFKFVKINQCSILASRTGFTGELGYELFINSEDCPVVWDTVLEAGKKFGCRPYGLKAGSGVLRLEKGYIGGKEYNETINPYEAGLGWTVKLNTDFIGKEALSKIKEKGPERKLMGFVILEKNVNVSSGNKVLSKNEEIGMITSATYSPILNKHIALGYVKTGYEQINSKVKITIDKYNAVDAILVSKVFYDSENKKLKA